MERVILAYSGGLDTSVAIPWIKEKYDAEVITFDQGWSVGFIQVWGLPSQVACNTTTKKKQAPLTASKIPS